VSLVGGTDFQLLGESNLADRYWMCEAGKTIHPEKRAKPAASQYNWAGHSSEGPRREHPRTIKTLPEFTGMAG